VSRITYASPLPGFIRKSVVPLPTVVRVPLADAGKIATAVQWFGEGRRVGNGSQFLFEIVELPEHAWWWALYRHLGVVFLGQVKNCPDERIIKAILKDGKITEDGDDWMIWTTSLETVGLEAEANCAGFWPKAPSNVSVVALVHHRGLGRIQPRPHSDLSVLEEAERNNNSRFNIACA